MFRSLIALPCTLVLFRLEGNRGIPTTRRHKLEYVRGLFLVLSYTTHFMGLASLPLADIASIRFSAPLIITLLSVVLLGEKVRLYKWVALIVGFMGVLFIVRPGTPTFSVGSIFILISTLFYTFAVMLTRQLRTTDSGATMAYFSSLVYLIASFALAPLPFIVGDVSVAQPGIAFLFRDWTIPTLLDAVIMSGLGLVWAGGMFFMARAYSVALASVAAPFEYVTLPINVMWGFVLWHEVPSTETWIGALLTIGSGLYILYREQRAEAINVAHSSQPVT
jgi:drug/metabolite transporter (DMT)-like permease